MVTNRTTSFVSGEFYHCFNRGVDKRTIFQDAEDYHYFLTALELFHKTNALGDMRHYRQAHHNNESAVKQTQLVSIIAYCLNPNHFHLLFKQETEDGSTQFMRKVGTGYTVYFNKKYKRSGSLFQGQFKSVIVENDIQLQHLFAYVTENNRIHNISDTKRFRNSFAEAVDDQNMNICNIQLIQSLFGNNTKGVVKKGIQHTIAYRKEITSSEKSELLE